MVLINFYHVPPHIVLPWVLAGSLLFFGNYFLVLPCLKEVSYVVSGKDENQYSISLLRLGAVYCGRVFPFGSTYIKDREVSLDNWT